MTYNSQPGSLSGTRLSFSFDLNPSDPWRPHAVAAEELVAEIGASILGAHLGLPPDHLSDHAAYIGHRMKILKDDKRAFLSAAAQAQTAVDWLLAKAELPLRPIVTSGLPTAARPQFAYCDH